jgi:hypothetical protein
MCYLWYILILYAEEENVNIMYTVYKYTIILFIFVVEK